MTVVNGQVISLKIPQLGQMAILRDGTSVLALTHLAIGASSPASRQADRPASRKLRSHATFILEVSSCLFADSFSARSAFFNRA